MPNHLLQDGFVHSIHDKGSTVKIKYENVTESKNFKNWFGDWQNKLSDAMYKKMRQNSVNAGVQELVEGYGLSKPADGDGEKQYLITDIVGEKQAYGKGVFLNTDVFDGVHPRKWGTELSKYVYNNLAGQSIQVYDEAGNAETISFAKKNERVTKDGAKNSHRVIDELARAKGNIKSLSVVHIDELLQTAEYFDFNDENTHQWLDRQGWNIRKTYVQDKNGKIFEVLLNIGKAEDGRNILYALSNIKNVDAGEVPSASYEEGRAHIINISNNTIPQNNPTVKKENNGKEQYFIPTEGDDVEARGVLDGEPVTDDSFAEEMRQSDENLASLYASVETEHREQVERVAQQMGESADKVERVAEETAENAEAVLESEQVDTEFAEAETVAEIHAAYDTEFEDLEEEWKAADGVADDSGIDAEKHPTRKQIVEEQSKKFARKDALRRAEYADKFTEEYGYDHLKGKGLSKEEISSAIKQETIEDKKDKALFRLKSEQMMYKKLRERTDELAFMGRTGSDAENANLICLLASDEATYISGQNIQIDGCRKKQ